ncbi:MAG: fatty acid--CoA ligase family protein, partial [Actinomycetota bacterium]|nr:fatty acid--CoA ligase family protein [Actinomycetota bacterium]
RWGVEETRLICNMPINHSGCLGDNAATCLIAGGTLILMEDFDPDGMLDLISEERVNVLMQVPTQYQVLVGRDGFDAADLDSLELVVWGGAAMARPVLEKLLERDVRAQVVYGMSEAPASLTYSRSDANIEQLTATIGQPDPEIELRIADENGTECPAGEAGEIQVLHDSIFVGYFDDLQATEKAFTADGFLRTGDQAMERQDGYLQLVGRLKEMYKSGGYNVYPREIEMTLERHPAVSAAVVVSIPDPLWSEIGCAFVVPRPGETTEVGDLLDWCRAELANYKVPKKVTVLSELPLLPIGKPDKAALRAMAKAGDEEEVAPTSGSTGGHA